MSEALPYIGGIIGFFTPIGWQGGFMIGSLLGSTAAETPTQVCDTKAATKEAADDDRQHSS